MKCCAISICRLYGERGAVGETGPWMTVSKYILLNFCSITRLPEQSSTRDHMRPPFSSTTRCSSHQLGIQGYFGIEDLGHRAILLGLARHAGEGGFVQIRHLGAQRQCRPTDAEALSLLL
jgi:hypothetical protein